MGAWHFVAGFNWHGPVVPGECGKGRVVMPWTLVERLSFGVRRRLTLTRLADMIEYSLFFGVAGLARMRELPPLPLRAITQTECTARCLIAGSKAAARRGRATRLSKAIRPWTFAEAAQHALGQTALECRTDLSVESARPGRLSCQAVETMVVASEATSLPARRLAAVETTSEPNSSSLIRAPWRALHDSVLVYSISREPRLFTSLIAASLSQSAGAPLAPVDLIHLRAVGMLGPLYPPLLRRLVLRMDLPVRDVHQGLVELAIPTSSYCYKVRGSQVTQSASRGESGSAYTKSQSQSSSSSTSAFVREFPLLKPTPPIDPPASPFFPMDTDYDAVSRVALPSLPRGSTISSASSVLSITYRCGCSITFEQFCDPPSSASFSSPTDDGTRSATPTLPLRTSRSCGSPVGCAQLALPLLAHYLG